MFISVAGIAILYLAMNISVTSVIPWQEIKHSYDTGHNNFVVSTFIERLYGNTAAKVATVMILWVALASLFADMLKTMPELREKLWHNVNKLQNGLRQKGFDIGTCNSPVTPVFMKGDLPEATGMVVDMRENYNIFCSVVVFPVIPKGQIIFRLIPTAVHTDEDTEITLNAFEETKKKLDAGAYHAEEIPDMADVGKGSLGEM
jgi:glycine C-acetyltransferase